jgi:hypothetical protein
MAPPQTRARGRIDPLLTRLAGPWPHRSYSCLFFNSRISNHSIRSRFRSGSFVQFTQIRCRTWFPLQIQVDVNGHEWLARKLQQSGIRYTKRENALLWIEDWTRAQKFSDRFCFLDWPRLLNRYAKKD